MNRTLIVFFSALLIIFMGVFVIHEKIKNKQNTLTCQTSLSENSVDSMLTSHISLFFNLTDKKGLISFNGNIANSSSTYKLKRSISFSLRSTGNVFEISSPKEILTREDNVPEEIARMFNIINDDISFDILSLSKNKDLSYILYNGNEPLLICSELY